MNESGSTPVMPDASALAAPGLESATAGQLLRRAREAEGLHIAALAVALKVPVKKLEALEADRLDLLADLVFARALAGSFCRVLKVDPAPILARFPRSDGPRLKTDETGINEPFKGPQGAGAVHRIIELARKPLVIGVLVLVIGTLLLVFVPRRAVLLGQVSEDSPAVQQASVVAGTDVGGTLAHVLPHAEVKTLSAPPAQAVSAPVPEAAIEAPLLQLNARGTSWVEVVDAKGVVQLRRVVAAAEKVSLSGVAPLSVVLGKAGNVEVVVRGKAIDVTASTRDNVARFEVK
jgi:cytoskeleton protein RodZ